MLTEQGKVCGNSIVFSEPLALPEGTDVTVQIEPTPQREPVDAIVEPKQLTDEDFASLPFFGMWADREDMKDSTAWVRSREGKMAGATQPSGLIDSDILIDASRRYAHAIAFLKAQPGRHVLASVMSAMELLAGVKGKRDLRDVQSFLQKLTLLPITVTASQSAHQLMESFTLSHALSIPDALIAATAMEHGLTLYTKNLKHFQMIPTLQAVRPY